MFSLFLFLDDADADVGRADQGKLISIILDMSMSRRTDGVEALAERSG